METINQNNIEIEGSQEVEIMLEQWKVYVQMADNTSERRRKSNTFFTTINTMIISVCATNFVGINKNLVFITGILISLAWISSIRSYKMLNSAKFSVINKIEENLPMQGFSEEWDKLKGKKHFKLTTNEYYVPIAFIVIYIVYLYNNGAFGYVFNLFK